MPPTTVECPWCESPTPAGPTCTTCGRRLPTPKVPKPATRTSKWTWAVLALFVLTGVGATGHWYFTPAPPPGARPAPAMTDEERKAAVEKSIAATEKATAASRR
ncbi:hypothetical protein [Limnoglobus roseus]|uniref:Uncharacterized protein n=1 Tax=Limnoglobus roseus TaxID=2598579 RepID=A0A5C1AIV3_9BACT|nr:hypothetical protein [Limnoglobus roseus]QEL19369.1 hypothetical protein PX52LOC_06440 [Limnoglobus roseus]